MPIHLSTQLHLGLDSHTRTHGVQSPTLYVCYFDYNYNLVCVLFRYSPYTRVHKYAYETLCVGRSSMSICMCVMCGVFCKEKSVKNEIEKICEFCDWKTLLILLRPCESRLCRVFGREKTNCDFHWITEKLSCIQETVNCNSCNSLCV